MHSTTGTKSLYPAAALAVLMLAACSASTSTAPTVPPPEPRLGSGGKPGAPVAVQFSLPSKLVAGAPITVNVQVVSAIDGDELQLQWMPSAGLVLGATPNPVVITAPVKGRRYQQPVLVTASGDGEYFLGVMVTLRAGGSAPTRAVSARLNVGAGTVKAKPVLSTDSQQTLIEATPAQEKVSK